MNHKLSAFKDNIYTKEMARQFGISVPPPRIHDGVRTYRYNKGASYKIFGKDMMGHYRTISWPDGIEIDVYFHGHLDIYYDHTHKDEVIFRLSLLGLYT